MPPAHAPETSALVPTINHSNREVEISGWVSQACSLNAEITERETALAKVKAHLLTLPPGQYKSASGARVTVVAASTAIKPGEAQARAARSLAGSVRSNSSPGKLSGSRSAGCATSPEPCSLQRRRKNSSRFARCRQRRRCGFNSSMLSPVQAALDGAMATLQSLFPKQVQLSVAPTVNLTANASGFRRQRAQQDTGYQWIVSGQVVIRRAVLEAAAITTGPESGQKITVDGESYKIQFVTPDSTSFTLDCFNLF